jgi:hypothetical protein
MAAKGAPVVTLKEYLKLKPFPKRQPIVFLPRRDRKAFLGSASRVKLDELKGLIPKGSPVVELTSWHGGDVIRQACWSEDINIACIPEVRLGPFGVEVVRCRCFRVGVDEDEGPGIVITPPRAPRCALRISAEGTLQCSGECKPGMTCKLVTASGPGGWTLVACACRLKPKPGGVRPVLPA